MKSKMGSMTSPSVSRQFYLLLLLALTLGICAGTWLVYQFWRLSQEGQHTAQRLQRSLELNHELRMHIDGEIILLQQQFENLDPKFSESLTALNYSLGAKQLEYSKLTLRIQERLSVESIKRIQSELGVRASQIYEELLKGDRPKADADVSIFLQLADKARSEFDMLNELQANRMRLVVERMDNRVNRGIQVLLALVVTLSLVIGTFALLFHVRVIRPLRSIQEALDKIRQGDFTTRAQVDRNDEVGRIAHAFNFMAESLEDSYSGLERKVAERTQQIVELQEQLVQAAKLSAIGTLVSGVAHELNNPLTAIMGFAELTKMEATPGHENENVLKVLDDIHYQADRCRRIITNLLQFARQHKPQLDAIHINEVIEHGLQLREYELSTRNVKLVREYDPSNPLICADSYKIQQVILNLLNNAYDSIQETGRPGTIWIRTCILKGEIIIEFSDTGEGLRHPERVFEPFYTTKEVGKGTGLGLSVCYGIIQEHGGEIRATNWDKGARFIITLPIGEPEKLIKRPKQKNGKSAEPVNEGRQRHVLIVDNEAVLLKLQKSFLSRMQMTSDVVATGAEAIQYLKEKPVDVIISDEHMPGAIDGVQLYEWVCQNHPELTRRFIFLSGDHIAINANQHFLVSSVPRLQKPFKLSDYSRVIRQVLET
jgi:two-component system, NtrC family, sensor kinase